MKAKLIATFLLVAFPVYAQSAAAPDDAPFAVPVESGELVPDCNGAAGCPSKLFVGPGIYMNHAGAGQVVNTLDAAKKKILEQQEAIKALQSDVHMPPGVVVLLIVSSVLLAGGTAGAITYVAVSSKK